jgi:hypothetical protein
MYDICLYWHIYVFMYRLEYMYQCTRISPTVIGKNLIRNENFEAKEMRKSVFRSEKKYSKQKKGFTFVSLRSENNLVEAKRKIWSEKKRKNGPELFKWTSETHAKQIQFRFI